MTRTSREHVWWVWKREHLSIALCTLLLAMTSAMDMAHSSWTIPESENENSGFSLTSGTGFTPWDFGVVPYAIDPNVPADMRQRINTAIQIWEQQTPIRFITIEDMTAINKGVPPKDSVLFTHSSQDECYTYLGNQKTTKQEIVLGPNCSVGSILHEMGHKLGAAHEQVHPDEAKGITFRMDRVRDQQEGQYGFPLGSTTTATTPPTLGTEQSAYDTGSIMHYSAHGFTVCGSGDDPKWSRLLGPGIPVSQWYSLERQTCSVADWRTVTTPVNCLNWCAVMVNTANQMPINAGQRLTLSPRDIEGFGKMYPQARDIDAIYRTEASRPATAAELFTDGTDLQAGIRSLEQIRQDVRAAQPQEKLMSLRTRLGTYFNAYDSTGPVSAGHLQAHPDPVASDEIFRLIDLNGGALENGDLVVIRTRRGYYFNAWDSSGDVSASVLAYPPALNMAAISDEIFTLIKVGGSAGNTIRNEDRVVIRTRYGYYFNADGSRGKVRASRLAYYPDPTFSDEIFTIVLEEAIAHRAEVYHRFEALYQAVLGRAMDNEGWQTYFTFVDNGGNLEQVRDVIAHSPQAHGLLEGIYQAVLGRAIDDSGKQTYSNALANGWTLGQVRNAIAHSSEASGHLAALHQEIWGRPSDAAYLDYYTFLLSTGGTLTDVRADMEALHLQTVMVPVLSSIFILLQ